jgi:hypothetical protein
VLKISKVEQQDVQITFGIYCKILNEDYFYKEKKFVLIPRAVFLEEITELFKKTIFKWKSMVCVKMCCINGCMVISNLVISQVP